MNPKMLLKALGLSLALTSRASSTTVENMSDFGYKKWANI